MLHPQYIMKRNIFYFMFLPFIILCLLSFYGFRKYENINLISQIDLLLFFYMSCVFILKGKVEGLSLCVFIVGMAYAFHSYILGMPVFEIIVAVKYVVLLFAFVNSRKYILNVDLRTRFHVQKFITFLIVLMFIKYVISHVFDLNTRPLFFTENNFEVIIPLYVFFMPKFFGRWLRYIAFSVVLLSGSKSGIGSLIIISIYVILIGNSTYLKFLLTSAMVACSGYAITIIDLGQLEGIDRVRFAQGFLQSYTGTSSMLFGNFHIRPLPSAVCEVFSYMRGKVQIENGTYVCYSRVLHLFWFRILHDFGLLFAIGYIVAWYRSIEYRVPSERLLLLLFASLNGLSVSGFGNPFWLILLLVDRVLWSSRNQSNERRSD